MRVNRLEILAITALFVNYVTSDVKRQTTVETASETSPSDTEAKGGGTPVKSASSAAKNVTTAGKLDNWMARMGPMQKNLLDVQVMIVKDEDVNATNCEPATRKSNKRYFICAASILDRTHVLTSATCLHEATHIRHNIRAPLAVVIAPLKPSVQVITVVEYQVHPRHHSNPYVKDHSKHNVAILKLACRIEMENYHKVEFPRAPMRQTCNEENCIVAVYRKTGRTSNVMYQILAPDIPLPNRRRKETSVSDELHRGYREIVEPSMIDGVTLSARPKRKLAEPPIFGRKSASTVTLNVTSSKVSASTTDNSMTEPSVTTPPEDSIFDDDVFMALRGLSVSGNEPVKSFVVRSSVKFRSCAPSGSAVMVNHTQTAVVAVPCDPRQSTSRWSYSDLFDNLDWIQSVLQLWETYQGGNAPSGPKPPSGPAGNSSGCSTCIFNFFIEIGCKDKNQCGKNFTGNHGAHLPGQGAPRLDPEARGNAPATRRKIPDARPGCANGHSMGVEIGVGQGCEKTGKESDGRSAYAGKSTRPINAATGKQKHLSTGGAIGDGDAQLRQPVAGRPVKTPLADYTRDKAKYPGKDNSRASPMYKTPVGGNSHRESRVNNEIGLQNIEGDSGDWIADVEKGRDIGSAVKRELAKSRRPSIR